MAGSSFKFLHAGQFHLGQPLGGMTEIPDELVELLIDAPYQACQRVVDAALREAVDFVVLTGDLIHLPTATPGALDFLRLQLERLAAKRIPTYWLDGRLECGHATPGEFVLPECVQRFASGRLHRAKVDRDQITLASLVARPAGGDVIGLDQMRCPGDGPFSIGLWYGDLEAEINLGQLDEIGIAYWACGGRGNAQSLDGAVPVRYCGTPQGRRPSEQGPHGCLLVQVDAGEISTQFIETGAVRYQTQRLELDGTEDDTQLLALISKRLGELREELPDALHALLSWEVVDDGPRGRELRHLEGNERMLARIQRELSEASDRRLWTIGLRSFRTRLPASLWAEDTILGDFVRVVRQMEHAGGGSLDVSAYLPHGLEADKLAKSFRLDDRAARGQLLGDVAALGIDMLSGD